MSTMEHPRHEQAMKALAVGNQIRRTNADTVRSLKKLRMAEGMEAVAALLRMSDMNGPLGALPVDRLLRGIRGVHDGKIAVLLGAAGIYTPVRKLRRLSERQRQELARALSCAARYSLSRR